ncbi:hypothetical protein [Sorangium sp. So ce1000]|uniref:hypothetical protein n=1 Tax=Sorangium sp. So ce1000 TaxID=3133325 RepID=UPI003F60D4E8
MSSKLSSSSGPVRSHSDSASAGARPWRGARRAAVAALALLPVSCADLAPTDGAPDDLAEGEIAEAGQALSLSFPIQERKSLVVTNTDILGAFKLQDVLQQLIDQAGVSLTPLQLFRQFMDTNRKAADGIGLGPHCDDTAIPGAAGSINGWPIDCPRVVGLEADRDPFADEEASNAYVATTLSNRFDLAPPDGANCGEYRVVFARRSGIPEGAFQMRNFIIFEGRLPNPTPSLGREGCRPVVNFWYNLSDPSKSLATRRDELLAFYFDGLPGGFEPVIHINHYGQNAGPYGGQIRTNEFLFAPAVDGDAPEPFTTWDLREFRLLHSGSGSSGTLVVTPSFVKDNPAAPLFDPASTDARAVTFRNTSFPNLVERLAATDDINRFALEPSYPTTMNAGESQMIGLQNNYFATFGAGTSALRTSIQNKLTAMGSALTPDQVVGRAFSLSCSGCHEPIGDATGSPSVPLDLGTSATLTKLRPFTQTSEQLEADPDEPGGQRFKISEALTGVFIPFRKNVMAEFLLNNPILGFEKPGAWTSAQALLSVHTGRVKEGISSLQVQTPSSFNTIVSSNFSAASLAPVGNKITLDLFISPVQPNPSWVGNIEVLISIPSAGIFNQWAGNVPLTPLTRGQFVTIQFAPLATATKTALNAGASDVTLQFNLNVTSNSGPYYLDNVRFEN